MGKDSVKLLDFDVFPEDIIGTCSCFDPVDLQPDVSGMVTLKDDGMTKISNGRSIDKGLDARTFCYDTEVVPLAVFHVFVRMGGILGLG